MSILKTDGCIKTLLHRITYHDIATSTCLSRLCDIVNSRVVDLLLYVTRIVTCLRQLRLGLFCFCCCPI